MANTIPNNTYQLGFKNIESPSTIKIVTVDIRTNFFLMIYIKK